MNVSRTAFASLALLALLPVTLTGCGRRVVHVDREVEVHAAPPPHVHRDIHVDRDVDVHVHPRPRVHRDVDIEIERDVELHRKGVPPRVRHHRRHH